MQSSSAARVWILAALTSLLGAAILFSASPGINWAIWVTTVSVSLVALRLASGTRVETPLIVLLAWATLLSFGLAITDSNEIQFYIVVSGAMLLGLATISIGVERWSSLSARLLATVPIAAPARVLRATALRIAEAPRSTSSPRSRAIIKGALLSAPLVVILFILLGNADPVIHWSTNRIAELMPDWSYPPRIFFFLFLLSITLGANATSTSQAEANLPRLPGLPHKSLLGVTEQKMILWSAAVVLSIFVLLQVSYLIHPPPAVLDSGITFAEYARRGFGELSFAATLVAAIILVLEYERPSDTSEGASRTLVRLELALIVALELVILSAFRRVVLYENAYGFTTTRVFAQAYMLVVALALIALAVEVVRGAISIAFGRRVAEYALGVFTVLVFWNYEGWIVNRNIDRAERTGKFDWSYALNLSRDAIPVLIERRAEIPPKERAGLEAWLACARPPVERQWFEWNRSVSAANRAMRRWPRPACTYPGWRSRYNKD